MKIALTLLVILFCVSSAPAQELPRVELFAGYSYLNFDLAGGRDFLSNLNFSGTFGVNLSAIPNRLGVNGWQASAAVNLNRWFGFEADLSGHYKGNCVGLQTVTCRNFSFLAGPRFNHRRGKITVFAHGLFGYESTSGHINAANLVSGVPELCEISLSASNTSFVLALGGGLDFSITKTLSLRAGQVDYYMTQHFHNLGFPRQNSVRVAAGVVFKLGR